MAQPDFESTFTKSATYRNLSFSAASAAVRESSRPVPRGLSERHLQCIWYDEYLRPAYLTASGGEPVTVINPGRWNLEAGPDFLDAVLSVGSGAAALRGDVEIHIAPADWTAHGHGADPAYSRVVAHVCLKNGERPECLPSCAVQIHLGSTLSIHPEDIDTSSYPYSMPSARTTRCRSCFPSISYEKQLLVLSAAGHERLRLKACRMMRLMEDKGPEQAFYEEVMAALGYKHNRAPFRRLAAALPVDRLQDVSGGNAVTAYAVLMGKAGLLPVSLPDSADSSCRTFLRELWDKWWRHEASLPRPGETVEGWRRAGVRPQNHPQRRLAAAACMFCRKMDMTDILNTKDEIPCLDRHLTLGGPAQGENTALLGTERKSAILANIIVPFMAACGRDAAAALDMLPPQDFNSVTKEMMNTLMGGDYNPAKYRHALVQQGLIQVFNDFCTRKDNSCEQCKFAAALRETMLH